jgi:sigma-B regulation protein RsbU (phosphoserine phosphatase)
VTEDLEATSGAESPDFLGALLDDDPNELYENAPCGYVSTLPDGTIVKANQTFLTWTGYQRAELVGHRRLQELFAVGDRIFYETHFAPLLRMQGRVREIAIDLIVGGGDRLPVLANAILKRDPAGEPQLIRTVLFDARERRAYERELVAARERAEEAKARARQLAETLQATFFPPTALVVPGLDIAGVYRPAGDGSEVGGDFYDVFPTGRGTHAVVLGDVSGKGALAAVVTALARHVIRGETMHEGSPAKVLAVLHEAIRHAHPDRFSTVLLLEIAVADTVVVTVASAGHQLPIRTDGRRTDRVGSTGTLVGMLDEVRIRDTTFELGPEDVVVLYTDGVTEARNDDRKFFGEERLVDLVTAHAAESAAAIASALADSAVDFQHGWPRDDIAIVVLRRRRS